MPNMNEDDIETLLDLLDEYLTVADKWEAYYTAAANKEYTLTEDKAKHAYIQRKFMIPLMERCRDSGFRYADLMDIIPTAFETTSQQRDGIYHDLLVAFSPPM